MNPFTILFSTLVASALAQQSDYTTAVPTRSIVILTYLSGVYTIPAYNPSNALSYGQYSSNTHSTTLARSTSTSIATVVSLVTPSSVSSSAQSAAASTTRIVVSPTSNVPTATQSTAAAAGGVRYNEVVGAVAGGLVAGLALL